MLKTDKSIGPRFSMAGQLRQQIAEPVLEVEIRLIAVEQHAQDLRDLDRTRICEATELLNQPIGVIVDKGIRSNCYEPL